MKTSPFVYGKIVSAKAFTNREEETKKLYSNLINRINTMIISPRRWGKSSLVEKVFLQISKKNKNIKTIIIDLFSVNSEEEFLEVFAKEVIKSSSSKWEDWAKSGKELFKQIIPKISFGIDPISDFSISFDWNELKKNKNEILNLPEIIAKRENIKFIIGLDEFQNLSSFSDYKNLGKNMRAVWQRQKNVTYCIYGSKRQMMREIFDNSSNAFYRFGDIIMLSKIKSDNWTKFIVNAFAKTNKNIENSVAKIIPKIMKNHSWYVQQLSHYTWNLTLEIATLDEIKKALEEVLFANTPLYQKEVEQLSKTQLNLLKAVAKNETQFMSTAMMQKYNLGTPRNVSKNITALTNSDMIHHYSDKYEFLDPAYELWFNRQFFNVQLSELFSN